MERNGEEERKQTSLKELAELREKLFLAWFPEKVRAAKNERVNEMTDGILRELASEAPATDARREAIKSGKLYPALAKARAAKAAKKGQA